MSDDAGYDYIAVFDEGLPPDPHPVRLLRTSRSDGQVVEETWFKPGAWEPSQFLIDLRLGHGDGEPRPVSREDMERWQQQFVEGWRARDARSST